MMTPATFAEQYFDGLRSIIDRIPIEAVARVVDEVERAYLENRQIFIVGNGGSASTASHMMTDLGKGTLGRKGDASCRRVRVMSLSDNVALMTAWANDTDYSRIFSEPLRNLAACGDLLVAISASGNSPNVVTAARTARQLGMRLVALTGFSGGELGQLADAALVVPSNDYGPIEDVHLILNHILVGYLCERLRSAEKADSGALA
jgi:D-sedoheptulose 7-phosphate isomerase